MNVLLRVVAGVAGAYVVVATILSAIVTVVLPRAVPVRISRVVFVTLRRIIDTRLVSGSRRTYERRDRGLALLAPLGLLVLPVVWISLVLLGYWGVFVACGVSPLSDALSTSASSVVTLGFARPDGIGLVIVACSEAVLGLILVALLITYLPSIYSAFSRREIHVSLLSAIAGEPPSPVTLISRLHQVGAVDRLDTTFATWSVWFADLEETHSSIGALVFFRSHAPRRSWVTAAGCILDAAAIRAACLDMPATPDAAVCLRSGFLALRRIADFYGLPHPADPQPDDPISIRRDEFDMVWEELADVGAPLLQDRDACWRAFSGWRVNYDVVLRRLAGLVVAPSAPWSSDRPLVYERPTFRLTRAQRSG